MHQPGQYRQRTGREQNGSLTTIAAITQLLPRPTWRVPVAEPSWNQPIACTFLPVRLNNVSSTATSTGAPPGTNTATVSLARTRPRSSALHRAAEKNRCAR